MTIKRVYMMTDLEGVAGIDDWDPRHRPDANSAQAVRDRAEMQRLLTGEVNAAAEGLFAAGVEEVLINDAHGGGRAILPNRLISGVTLVRGAERPSWLVGISPRHQALVQVGMHAMGYTPNACLCHSMSRGYRYRLNGRELGEMEMAGYLASELDIPWVFTSGDAHACREAESWVPGMITASVKEGLTLHCAIHLSPSDARNLIRERIQQAVQQADQVAPLPLPIVPVVFEIEREEPWPAEIKPGAERADAFTIHFVGDSFWQVFHHCFYNQPDMPKPSA